MLRTILGLKLRTSYRIPPPPYCLNSNTFPYRNLEVPGSHWDRETESQALPDQATSKLVAISNLLIRDEDSSVGGRGEGGGGRRGGGEGLGGGRDDGRMDNVRMDGGNMKGELRRESGLMNSRGNLYANVEDKKIPNAADKYAQFAHHEEMGMKRGWRGNCQHPLGKTGGELGSRNRCGRSSGTPGRGTFNRRVVN